MEETTTTRWRYISTQELYNLIKSSKISQKDYVVIDVRDEDFIGGNIKGCLHVPSRKYEELLDDLCTKVKDVDTVAFHCAYSQSRGPRAAGIYTQKQALTTLPNNGSNQQIFVLSGGFAAMQAMYKDDDTIIEGWDKSMWEYEFF